MLELVSYYCKEFRCWVTFVIDGDGNQVWECEYHANKEILKQDIMRGA